MPDNLGSVTVDVLYRLGDVSEEIWSTVEINGYIKEGYDRIVNATLPLWDFEYSDDVAGTATYSLPADLLVIDRVTWNWERIPPLTPMELREHDNLYRTNQGPVRAYSVKQDGLAVLRKWLVPSATATAGADANNTRIEYYQRGSTLSDPLDEFDVPRWFVKYVRCFALYRAYERKSKGQDLALAEHFLARYKTGEARLLARKKLVTRYRTGRMGGGAGPRRLTASPQLPWQYRWRAVR